MTEGERLDEWVRYYKACKLKVTALEAVLVNDGEKMLGQVLKRLSLEKSVDLLKEAVKK